MRLTIANARIIGADDVLAPGWLSVVDGRIDRLGGGEPPAPADLDARGNWLAPGFVDMHVHGGGGASFAEGDEIAEAAAFHRRNGTTTLLASLVTAPIAALERQVAVLADAVSSRLIGGVHLEGPWLSPHRAGAHDPQYLRAPTRADVRQVVQSGVVRMVTLAPELPGAIEAIRDIVDAGVVAAIGHTDATYAETCAGIAAGATVATHVFNAMRPLHHREPGPAVALLEDPNVTLELINDGVHLHPSVVRLVLDAAGDERVALVTDAIAAAGAADGDFMLGSLQVHVKDGIARLTTDDALAGSTLTVASALQRAVQTLGVPLPAAVRMASSVPAGALGMASEAGSIQTGVSADLVLLDDDANLLDVMWRGEWVKGWL
jgi:N-acetylglucosamine-6-phosphate deacetylase